MAKDKEDVIDECILQSAYATESTLGRMESNCLDTSGFVWYH